nr:ribonuclease D [Thermoleophilaceae bacterium]
TLHRRTRELIEAIAAGEGTEAPEVRRPPRRNGRDAPLVALCGALVRQRATDAKIASEVIGTQSDTATLVADVRGGREDESESRLLNGWRRELVGDELIELLRGRRSVGVSAEGGLQVARTDV